jgi:site-specific recombinase XerD
MRKVNIHSFRHFNASALIDSGVDVVTVQTALGHSTPATTLSIYSHAFGNAQTRAMEAIANAIDL